MTSMGLFQETLFQRDQTPLVHHLSQQVVNYLKNNPQILGRCNKVTRIQQSVGGQEYCIFHFQNLQLELHLVFIFHFQNLSAMIWQFINISFLLKNLMFLWKVTVQKNYSWEHFTQPQFWHDKINSFLDRLLCFCCICSCSYFHFFHNQICYHAKSLLLLVSLLLMSHLLLQRNKYTCM